MKTFSANASASSPHTDTCTHRVSPASSHWLVFRLKRRGVQGTSTLATAVPDGVNRSSGSREAYPVTVRLASGLVMACLLSVGG